mgnify:FL=1
MLMLDTDTEPPRADTMGLLVDWPGESPVPRKLIFLASETSPPPCAEVTLAAERTERGREELNGLYVAMTRARTQLVISSVQPFRQTPGSAWQRLQPLTAPAIGVKTLADDGAVADLDLRALADADAAPLAPFYLPDLPLPIVEWSKFAIQSGVVNAPAAPTPESRMGQAMHWLLETGAAAQAGAGEGVPGALAQAARDFELTAAQAGEAARLARNILSGEGAWAWDPSAVDWQGNEVALLHQGRLLRLDRLVHRSTPAPEAGWWVLDYKMSTTPEQQAELLTQLRDYRAAVQAAYPGQPVTVAFLTGDGRQVLVT